MQFLLLHMKLVVVVLYYVQVMPKKFRLSVQRKNECRRQRNRTVTIQHEFILTSSQPIVQSSVLQSFLSQSANPPQSVPDVLRVSIPRNILHDCEVSSVIKLQERIKALSVLPQGMLTLSLLSL